MLSFIRSSDPFWMLSRCFCESNSEDSELHQLPLVCRVGVPVGSTGRVTGNTHLGTAAWWNTSPSSISVGLCRFYREIILDFNPCYSDHPCCIASRFPKCPQLKPKTFHHFWDQKAFSRMAYLTALYYTHSLLMWYRAKSLCLGGEP